MLVNADIKSLELCTCADLSGDLLLSYELSEKVDIHADNQSRFHLPARVVAKRFIFKLIFGATAYGYFVDSDFLEVGYSQKQWQEVIDRFYEKYVGIKKWHDEILITAMRQGYLEIPSGRYFSYTPNQWGKWPLTTIKNYPVQGWGADLVKLARIEFRRKLKESGLNAFLVGTIHDSLVADCQDKDVDLVAKMLQDSIEAIPDLSEKHYGYRLSLPIFCEIQAGPNKKDMETLTLS